jgi:hypothetical protein
LWYIKLLPLSREIIKKITDILEELAMWVKEIGLLQNGEHYLKS